MGQVDLFSVSFSLCSPFNEETTAVVNDITSVSSWLQQLNFPIPFGHVPSRAAQYLFSLSTEHGISIRLQRVDEEPYILIATFALDGEGKDVPKCILEGSKASLEVLSHYVRQDDCCGDILTCTKISMCGFMCCNDRCVSNNVVQRKEYHLDHVFSDCSAAEENDAVREANFMMKNLDSRIGPKDRLSRLPHDVLSRIVSNLTVADVQNLKATSRLFRAATQYFVPGLSVQLYPHQLAALNRMRRMEGGTEKRCAMPMLRTIRPLAVGCHFKLFADLCEGSLYIHSHFPSVSVLRGGILADEPGLGKTVTGIALVLKSLHQRSKPPEIEHIKSYVFTRKPSRKRRRSSNNTNAPNASSVNVKYYETLMEEDIRYRRKPAPKRRVRILNSRNMENPTQLKLRINNSGMVTRRKVPPIVRRVRILLSSCTLVLCPKPLVVHWVSQIQECTSNRLRVLAIRKCSELPSKEVLALNYDVIVLSFTVVQWLNEKMKREHPSIFQVRFLRIFYDEGHEMGKRSEYDTVFRMINFLNAERRWIMTGTPTPSNPYSDVRFLRPLLMFLREPLYGMDNETWVKRIQKPYGLFRPESLFRLKQLLRQIMIRSEKQTISSIPKCTVSNVFLKFPKQSADSYNELVMAGTRNIVLCDWFSEYHRESLLNELNKRHCMQLISNLRKTCVFGGGFTRIDVTLEELEKTLDILYSIRRRGHGALCNIRDDDVEPNPNMRCLGVLTKSKVYLGRLGKIASGFMKGDKCEGCGSQTRIPYVTPCAHLVCNKCLLTDRTGCPVKFCGTKYSLDANLVPEEFIELQPSMVLGQWKLLGSIASVKMDYLIDKLVNTELTERIIEGKLVCRRKKVIVYSQFDDHLFLTAIHLKEHEQLENSYTELYPNKGDFDSGRVGSTIDQFIDSQLTKFRDDNERFILLLGKKYGSVGLDLSFVENIYLLEPFWDAALEKQVISRAHRMGAKAPIEVERLLIKGTIEEDAIEHAESLRQSNTALSTVSAVAKELQKRSGLDVLLRMTPVRNQKTGGIASPITPSTKRSFPILDGYVESQESAEKTGRKRVHELEVARKKRVRKKLWG